MTFHSSQATINIKDGQRLDLRPSTDKMNTQVGYASSAPSYHEMSIEEYQKMCFVPTKRNSANKQQSEQEQATLQGWHQGKCSVGDIASKATDHNKGQRNMSKDPLPTTSYSPWERRILRSHNQPEVRHLSGNFNAPTQVEVDHHDEAKSLRGFRGTIKGWMRKSSSSTVV